MPRYEAPPKPRLIAKRMSHLCDKLNDGGDTAIAVARDNQSPLRARNYSSDRTHGRSQHSDDDPGYNDQTGSVACSRATRAGTLYDSFIKALRGLDLSVTKVDGVYDDIMGKAQRAQAQRQLRDEAQTAGSGHCVACAEWMPGGEDRNNRIVEGLCPAHRVGLDRAKKGGETRSDYIARVRRRKGLESVDGEPSI